MEVVDFTVIEASQRRIDDWTNPFGRSISTKPGLEVEEAHAAEGIANQWIGAGDAEADRPPCSRTSRVVPMSTEPTQLVSNMVVEVSADGWFSVSLSTPHIDDGLPSNTFFELRPSLRAGGHITAVSSEDRTVVLTPALPPLYHSAVSTP